jgi:hypothetical protein
MPCHPTLQLACDHLQRAVAVLVRDDPSSVRFRALITDVLDQIQPEISTYEAGTLIELFSGERLREKSRESAK